LTKWIITFTNPIEKQAAHGSVTITRLTRTKTIQADGVPPTQPQLPASTYIQPTLSNPQAPRKQTH